MSQIIDSSSLYADIKKSTFSPLIQNYLNSVHAIIELSSRLLVNDLNEIQKNGEAAVNAFLSELASGPDYKEELLNNHNVTPLMGEQILAFPNGQKIVIDPIQLARYLLHNQERMIENNFRQVEYMIITAYALTEGKYRNNDPLWQFFRHVRNAAAHGGKFNLQRNQPDKPAEWGEKRIERGLNGKRLVSSVGQEGFLETGEIILLLLSVEEKFNIVL